MVKENNLKTGIFVALFLLTCILMFANTTAKQIDFLASGFNVSGKSLSGGKVYFYTGGSSFGAYSAPWLDKDKTLQSPNPLTLDGNGRAIVFGDGFYDIRITTATGSQVLTMQNVEYKISSIPNPLGVINGGTGSTIASLARSNLGVAIGSNVQAWNSNLDLLSQNNLSRGVFANDAGAPTSQVYVSLVGTGGNLRIGKYNENDSIEIDTHGLNPSIQWNDLNGSVSNNLKISPPSVINGNAFTFKTEAWTGVVSQPTPDISIIGATINIPTAIISDGLFSSTRQDRALVYISENYVTAVDEQTITLNFDAITNNVGISLLNGGISISRTGTYLIEENINVKYTTASFKGYITATVYKNNNNKIISNYLLLSGIASVPTIQSISGGTICKLSAGDNIWIDVYSNDQGGSQSPIYNGGINENRLVITRLY